MQFCDTCNSNYNDSLDICPYCNGTKRLELEDTTTLDDIANMLQTQNEHLSSIRNMLTFFVVLAIAGILCGIGVYLSYIY